MVIAERIWICPALCGCELRLTALWPDVADADGTGRAVAFAHPVPGTITAVSVVAVCPVHTSLQTDPFPAVPFYGSPGYLPIPATPTAAERLYIHLYRYSGNLWKPDTCGCSVYYCHDRARSESSTTPQHHRHTKKCVHHVADTNDHAGAKENNSRKNRLVERAITFLNKQDAEFSWAYDANRVLQFTILNITVQERNAAQSWADTNVGAGRVNVIRG